MEKASMSEILPGRYRHYKGNEYTVVGTARSLVPNATSRKMECHIARSSHRHRSLTSHRLAIPCSPDTA